MSSFARQPRGRYVAAAASALVAVIYLLIGFSIVSVVDDQAGLVPPMLIAAAVFAALAVLLMLSTSRLVLIAGAALQVLVLAGYVAIASERTPAYEAWGITVKAVEAFLLIVFVYLAVQRPRQTDPQTADKRTLARV
jgi:hypothetical protein